MKTKNEIFELLTHVPDPEIPVLNIMELGIIRDVRYENDLLTIDITPTYSGCPAIEVMKEDICSILLLNGIPKFELNLVYSPAWTTDWISEEALLKLKRYGIAPPSGINKDIALEVDENIKCPFCESETTELRSWFGSTACKSLYFCNSCNQPFEHFKKF